MAWWREARFGLFIHWGLYAIPAGEWRGETDHGEWIRETAHIPLEEYERLQGEFDPVRFDADEWVALAREAGMRYLVITSKHHDGFCLFDSAHTEWDVMGTPFARDILAELSAACERDPRSRGRPVRFCTYHSIMDWHHPDYLPRRGFEARSGAGADYERFEDYLHAQVSEVITKYHPGVLWFDGEWESTWSHERGLELYGLCRRLDPELIVNNRVDVHRGGLAGFSRSSAAVGDFGTPEQEIPATGLPGVDWETCMTMNDHWGFNAHDRSWKSTEELVRNLIEVVSKGGNYLLNVGPMADGSFPDEAIVRLRGIGAWMQKHGEAIHGTSASPFDPLTWGRCTVKRRGARTILYLHVFVRPADGRITLPGLASEPLEAGWLAGPRIGLPVAREGADVIVELPPELPDPIASVIALAIAGEPVVHRAPELVAESDVFVERIEVRLGRREEELDYRFTLDGSEPSPASSLITESLAIDRSVALAVRGFDGDRPVTALARRALTQIAPRPALPAADVEPGLRRERYSGDWNALPDFGSLLPSEVIAVPDVALPEGRREEHVAYRFRGLLEVPHDELYVFALTCDDGGRLWIGGELVIDNDGLHTPLEKRGQAALAAGPHEIEVAWFNRTGGAELSLSFAPLGGELGPLRELERSRE